MSREMILQQIKERIESQRLELKGADDSPDTLELWTVTLLCLAEDINMLSWAHKKEEVNDRIIDLASACVICLEENK